MPALEKMGIKGSSYGDAEFHLGMQVHKNADGSFEVTQKAYIEDMYAKFVGKDSDEYKTATAPMRTEDVPGDKYMALNGKDALPAELDYRGLIGTLMYAAVRTKPETSFAVCLLARYCACPSQVHYDAALQIVKYMKNTSDQGLKYWPKHMCQNALPLVGHVDASEFIEAA